MKIVRRLAYALTFAVGLTGMTMVLSYKTYDAGKASRYATGNTLSTSHNCCAGFVMRALWQGNCFVSIYPAWAYKRILPLYGFKEVPDNGMYLTGDIIVFPKTNGHIFGHIAIWNGQQWVSDFRQRNKVVATAYHSTRPTLLRHVK